MCRLLYQIGPFTPNATNLLHFRGVFKVRLTDYCERTKVLPDMAFKLFQVSTNSEITDTSLSTNRYSDGYWYTGINGEYDFALPNNNYQIKIKSLIFNMGETPNGADTDLTILSIQSNDQNFTPNNTPSVVHILVNPLQHTPLYKNAEAIAMCVSLTPNRFINDNDTPINTKKYCQELITWAGYYGGHLRGNLRESSPAFRLFKTDVLNTYTGYGDYQIYLRNNSDGSPRDGFPDGLSILALASAYQNQLKKRRYDAIRHQTKILVNTLSIRYDITHTRARTEPELPDDIDLKVVGLREDAAWYFHQFIEEVECRGGRIIMGTMRNFNWVEILGNPPANQEDYLLDGRSNRPPAGRSLTSPHYCGLACDFDTTLGLVNPSNDLYVAEKNPTTNPDRPKWIVWCKTFEINNPQNLSGWRYAPDNHNGGFSQMVNGNYINITEIAERHGIYAIFAHNDWRTSQKNATEWHHFQYQGVPISFSVFNVEMNRIGYEDNAIIDNYLRQVYNRAVEELATINNMLHRFPAGNCLGKRRKTYLEKIIKKFGNANLAAGFVPNYNSIIIRHF